MKFYWLGILILFSLLVSGQSPTSLQGFSWDQKEVKHAAIGVCVKNVENGSVVYEYNAGMALRPASVVKLLSSALALKREGDSLTYKTDVFYTGKVEEGILIGNILVRAGGDPTLESKYYPETSFMNRVVESIVGLGIKQVAGSIIVETGSVPSRIPGSWSWEDVANYYGALYHSFNYRDNTYTINMKSGDPGTSARVLSVSPSVPGVKFQNEVVSSVKNSNDAWIFGGPEASTLLIQGTIPANRSSFAVKGAMHHPEACFRIELEKRLKKRGITIAEKEISDEERQLLLTETSPLLKDIVYYTNKNSVNLFAEALGKLVNPTDFEKSVKRELNDIGIDSCGIILKDASGLSPTNAVSAETFTNLLLWTRTHLGDSFLSSLPLGGVDWGLRVYSDHPVLRGNLVAKTGSMFGVRALSGYLKNQRGEVLAFTILVNNYVGDPLKVQEIIRDFLKEIAEK